VEKEHDLGGSSTLGLPCCTASVISLFPGIVTLDTSKSVVECRTHHKPKTEKLGVVLLEWFKKNSEKVAVSWPLLVIRN
jgi:hypothetical protein